MQPRPPVVAILGHVDHGKTTLLDFIRKSHIAAKEHGGITQRIGAYEISLSLKGYANNRITFIDTPGHEAFSQLRARGANVADIALLIIDAKDSLMPQTIESLSHIQAAKIPFIVVLNKIDLPEANPNKVSNDLLKHNVMTEEKGGQVPSIAISAKSGQGIENLLESILLMASELNLTYNPETPANAYIIETRKDKRGIMATAIIKDGTLKVGQDIYLKGKKVHIRSLINDLGMPVSQVQPSMPFEMMGFEEMPEVGSRISTTLEEQEKTSGAEEKQTSRTIDMASLLQTKKEEEKKLSLIIKADSQGSIEAIIYSLAKNQNIDIILSGVGDIHRSDIFLAKTTNSIIIGFGTAVNSDVIQLAKQEKIIIKTYNIIYELLKELSEVADLLKEKETRERNLKGEAKILATFIVEGEKIFGIKVTKGKINIGDNIETLRNGNAFGKTKLISLKTRAKTVEEVKKGQEAGMVFSPPIDIKVGDVVQSIL